MSVNEIMQPYFDKKNKIDNYIKLKKIKESLESKLIDVRKSKYYKIQEMLNRDFLNKDNYLGYESVRKDMEKEYLGEEQVLEQQIKKIETELQSVNYNVDDEKQLPIMKEEIRKQLKKLQIEFKSKLDEIKIQFQTLMLRLSNFKYIYDENHIVQNGEEYKKLFDKVRDLLKEKNNLEYELNKIEEYLPLTELSGEDLEIIMIRVNELQKEQELNLEIHDDTKEIEDDDEELVELSHQITINKEERELIVENVANLLKEVYCDIVNNAIKLRQEVVSDLSEEDENIIKLPYGTYINESDLNRAIEKYYAKNKGRTFKVLGISEEITITDESIKKLQESLKKCSAVKLVRDKKIGSYDLTRVYGREKVNDIESRAKSEVQIMEDRQIYTSNPQGWYINGEEFAEKLPLLFETYNKNWIEKKLCFNEQEKNKTNQR